MRKTLLLAVAAALLGAQAAQAGSANPSARKKPPQQTSEPRGQIACTRLGCQRIPPNCHPKPGMTFDGMPTGYDDIICH